MAFRSTFESISSIRSQRPNPIAELDLDEKPPILPVQCAHYLIAADAYLLIVPTKPSAAGDHHIVEEIMCLSRCDAMMVRVARPSADEKRVLVDIGIDGLVPVWFREYRPCLIQRALHFVPDQDASKFRGALFRVRGKRGAAKHLGFT